ncbi:proton pump-interactor [Spatholobus suberectus]|nr:proton pump-interactor [Spatholobus suberectus]
MEEKETMSHANPSLESDRQGDFFPSSQFEVGSELDGRPHVIDDSGHVSKLVHRFYYVKLWPTNPDSISLIKKLESLNYWQREWTSSMVRKGKILNDLHVALEDLCFVHAPERRSNKTCFMGVLDNHVRWNAYLNNWQKLLREIEQFQIQCERTAGNAFVKGKISNYETDRN